MIYLYLFGTCFHFIYVFMIIAKYGFLGYRRNVNTPGDSFGLKLTSEDLSIGFHYAF